MILGEEIKPPLDELVHFGVKGMKWGVRKEDPAAKSARKAQKKAFNAEMGKVLDNRFANGIAGFGVLNGIPKEEYDRLSTKGQSWVAGAELYRVVSKKNKNYEDRYVSTNKQDRYNYQVGLGTRLLGISKIERHEITLKAVNKLSSPSPKERVDAFIALMDKPAIQLENGKVVSGREVLKKQGYGDDVKRLDATKLGLKYYNEFLANQFMDTPLNNAYFHEVRSRGYNALIDDNDRGILAKEPLILLNPSGDVKRMSIKPLTKQDVQAAEQYFKAP